ncbi:MAG: M56 family metallopeptidase [Candidatus Hydrogenedentes bacterium]|nr:M56 family metallopeptidase [Candidatus Hydrogenedentota bacterium]
MPWLLVQHLTVCAVLAGLVAVACRAGRLRPAIAHVLWLMVLVRLVVPPVIAWPWSPASLGWMTARVQQAGTEPGTAESYREQWDGVTVTPAVPVSPDAAAAPNERPAAPWVLTVSKRAAAFTWLSGTILIALVQAIRLLRFNKRLRGQRGAPDWIEAESATLAQRLGLPAPRVRVVDGIASPLFYGWRRPSILIPAALIEAIPRDRWPGVLAHELAHCKRRDHWVRGLELLAGCLWWWNPVFWFVRHHIRQTAELACDAWVVWALPEARKTYAKTLIDLSEMIALGNQPAAALGIGHGSRRSFERRLTMVMRVNGRANASYAALLCAALVLAVSVPVFANAQPQANTAPPVQPAPGQTPTAPSPPGEASEGLVTALDSHVSIQFKDEHISRILEFLAEYVSANIVIDYRVVQPPLPVDPRVPREDRPADTRVPEEFGYATDGMIPSIKLEDVPLWDALTALCEPLGLTYVACPQYVWISTEEMIAETDFADPSAEADPDLAQRLEKNLALEFEDEHIARILEFLGDYTHVSIVLDQDAVPPPPPDPMPEPQLVTEPMPMPVPGQPLPPGVPPGAVPVAGLPMSAVPAPLPHKELTPEGPRLTGLVPYIKMQKVTLQEILKALLLPLNLTYRVEPGRIYVTAPGK